MKRFLIQFIIFIAPLAIPATLIEVMIRRIPNDYKYKKHYLDQHSDKIEVLFLGSSHAYYGIDPEYIRLPAFNASMVSQPLNFDWGILNKYDGRWNDLKCIVVPIDYFSLYNTLEASTEKWRIKNYNIYYGIRFKETNTDANNYEILSLSLDVNLSRIYNYYFNHENNISCSELGWGTSYRADHKEDLVIAGASAAQRHLAKNDQYVRQNVNVLRTMIDYARSKKIKILFYTSPAYKTYTSLLDTNQLNRTIDTVFELARTNDNVFYFNFLNDPSFVTGDFFDADHLNAAGARKLSLKIDSLLPIILK